MEAATSISTSPEDDSSSICCRFSLNAQDENRQRYLKIFYALSPPRNVELNTTKAGERTLRKSSRQRQTRVVEDDSCDKLFHHRFLSFFLPARQLRPLLFCLVLCSWLGKTAAEAVSYSDHMSHYEKIHTNHVTATKEMVQNPQSLPQNQQSQRTTLSLCTLCVDEEKPSNPEAIVTFSDETVEREIFSVSGSRLSCAVIETELYQVEITDQVCQEVLQQTSSVCVCAGEGGGGVEPVITKQTLSRSQQKILVWSSRGAAVLSGLASLYILIHGGGIMVRGSQQQQQAMIHRSSRSEIMKATRGSRSSKSMRVMNTSLGYHQWNVSFWIMALCTLVASVGWGLSSLPIPSSNRDAFYGASGSEAACKMQGFLIQWGITGSFFTLMCTTLAVLEIRRFIKRIENNEHRSSSLLLQQQQQRLTSKCLSTFFLLVGAVLAGVGISHYSNPSSKDADDDLSQTSGGVFWVCYIQGPPVESSILEAAIFTFGPVWISLFASALSVLWMFQTLQKQKEPAEPVPEPEPTIKGKTETNSTTQTDNENTKIDKNDMLVPQRLLSSFKLGSSQKIDGSESEVQDDFQLEHEPEWEPQYEPQYEIPEQTSESPRGERMMRRGSAVAVGGAFLIAAQEHHRRVQEAAAKSAQKHQQPAEKPVEKPEGPPPMESVSVPSQRTLDVGGSGAGMAHELQRLRLRARQCAWCVVALSLSLPFLAISQLTSEAMSGEGNGDKYFPWWVIVALCAPLHGFWNCVVFLRFAGAWSQLDAQVGSTLRRSKSRRATAEQAPSFDALAADGDTTASLAPAHEKRFDRRKQTHTTRMASGVFQVLGEHEVKELEATSDHELLSLSSVTESVVDEEGNAYWSAEEDGMHVADISEEFDEVVDKIFPDTAPINELETSVPSMEHADNSSRRASLTSGSLPTAKSSVLQRKGDSAFNLENSLSDRNSGRRS
mmetsp:Transcript_8866/g.24559  ORF Transcript_8866/g.24559 Transcript_8866/m.24559 type:complete len:946 (-) Transcript_8866:205-3042(-)